MRLAATLEALLELAWGLEAAEAPALYLVLDEVHDRVPGALAAQLGPRVRITRTGPQGPGWLERLLGQPPGDAIDIVEGGLSSLPQMQRGAFNAGRERLITPGRKLVFVEPRGKTQELLRDFPDVISVVREIFAIQPAYADDHLYESGEAWRLRAIARRLPPVLTRGATIVQSGKVHYKQAPQIHCPRCGQVLRRGTTTMVFHHAPPAQREQPVSAWICPCGESYVPGAVAREAHALAFRYREGQDEFEIHLDEAEKHRLVSEWARHGPQGPLDLDGEPDLP
jgi:hypothetical protein